MNAVLRLLALLCLSGQVGAAAFSGLITGQSAPALYPTLPTYTLRASHLTLGVQGIDTAGEGKVGAALLLGDKWQLTPAELSDLSQLVGTLATQCFNISPERLPALSEWLSKRAAQSLNTPQSAQFGPLAVTYRPWQYTDATRVWSVVLSRKGTPGAEPWTTYCSLP